MLGLSVLRSKLELVVVASSHSFGFLFYDRVCASESSLQLIRPLPFFWLPEFQPEFGGARRLVRLFFKVLAPVEERLQEVPSSPERVSGCMRLVVAVLALQYFARNLRGGSLPEPATYLEYTAAATHLVIGNGAPFLISVMVELHTEYGSSACYDGFAPRTVTRPNAMLPYMSQGK